MEVRRIDDPAEFLGLAMPFLLRAEARNNLILGIADTLKNEPDAYPEFHLWLVDDDGEVAMAALRTPPFDLVISDGDDAAVAALLREIADESLSWPGVVGNRPTVNVFVDRWRGTTGRTASVEMRQGVFAATAAEDVPRAGGACVRAGPHDRSLIRDWLRAFDREAFPDRSDDERAASERRSETTLDARLERNDDSGLWLYRVDATPVSLAGFGGRTPNGIRVGPVYTPPDHRRRGYATELVAEMTRHLLASGRRFCFLYTDLANPTSNAIYERIGYRRICESAEYTFAVTP